MMRSIPLGAALLAAFALVSPAAHAQTLGCTTGGNGGLVPASGTGGGGAYPGTLPPFELATTINVTALPPGATCVTEIKLNGLAHTWSGDVHFVLTTPSGTRINLLNQQGDACDFAGDYAITSVELGQALGACVGGAITPGPVSQVYGSWPSGTLGIDNTALSSVAPALGTWTLTAYDWVAADAGALSSWDICFGTPPPPPPPTASPALLTPTNGAFLFGPNVTMTWSSVTAASGYDIDIDGSVFPVAAGTSYAFNSTAGTHLWAVRAKNAAGVGPWSTTFAFTDAGPPPQTCNGSRLATLFTGNGGLAVNNQMFFDVNVTKPGGITIAQLQTHVSSVFGSPFGLSVYTRSGSYLGFETSPNAWTLRASGTGNSAGANQPSLVELPDFPLAQGLHGFSVVLSGNSGHRFSGFASTQTYFDANVSISAGRTLNTPWTGLPNPNKVWNGALIYDCVNVQPPVTYCTAGTSTNGCVPQISATSQPRASLTGACMVSVTGLEGQKQGLLFYGINQTGFTLTPWGPGSTSYLCVRAPTQRLPAQGTGGSAGFCNGAISADLHGFLAANPTSLGMPFAVGAKIYAQVWYRDPPAVKTTNLSNAIELTVGP